MKMFTCIVTCLITISSLDVYACSPYFPSYYVALGNEYRLLQIVAPSFPQAYSLNFDSNIKPNDIDWRVPISNQNPEWRDETWKRTLLGDITDLNTALATMGINATQRTMLLVVYQDIRNRMYLNEKSIERASVADYMREWMDKRDPIPSFTPISEESVGSLLSTLPEEFALYANGAWAYRKGEQKTAIEIWEQLLSLPAEEREYRSTWAAYMLGRTHLSENPELAIDYFQQTREFINAGFEDSIQLTNDSLGWQACAESRMGAHQAALHHYVELEDYLSLRFAVSRALHDTALDDTIMEDPLCRELLITGLESYLPDMEVANRLCAALEEMGDERASHAAGNIARKCYMNGLFDDAQRWIDLAKPDDEIAQWVKSKLLLREGDFDAAVELLRSLVHEFPTETVINSRYGLPAEVSATSNRVCSELGTLLLGREDYITALDTLLRGMYWGDAAYVADYVLTLEELDAYIDTYAEDPALTEQRLKSWYSYSNQVTAIDGLRYLYARRLAREGRWKEATSQCPESIVLKEGYGRDATETSVSNLYSEYSQLTAQLDDDSLSTREHASKLMECAGFLRQYGMELSGSTLAPDWQIFNGRYRSTTANWQMRNEPHPLREERLRLNEQEKALKSLLTPSEDELKRSAAHIPKPDEIFHYRFRAADLMWEASQLLPDNDPMTARALWFGGKYIEIMDIKEADKFYKSLVRRCRRLPIGQEADRIRWFPPKPKDWGEFN